MAGRIATGRAVVVVVSVLAELFDQPATSASLGDQAENAASFINASR